MSKNAVYAIALPVPLRKTFDYYLENTSKEAHQSTTLTPGCRVKVEFGNRQSVGIIIEMVESCDTPANKLKPILTQLDSKPSLSADIMALCQWAANYYHHPLGEVLEAALPTSLRQPERPKFRSTASAWCLTETGLQTPPGDLRRGSRQQACLQLMQSAHPRPLGRSELQDQQFSIAVINGLKQKQLIESTEVSNAATPPPLLAETPVLAEPPLPLNTEQQRALDSIDFDRFQSSLIFGVTGSGKTEVYLQAIERVLDRGQQALVLIPEIGLTPQTLSRFSQRFNRPLAALHSGLSEGERLSNWQLAHSGRASIIIGTRSAIFTPLDNLGLIIIDEEHDTSFKQQEGFRYSAKDLAAVRASRAGIPLLLGSATPSLESLHNTQRKGYQLLLLNQRAGDAVPPHIEITDVRKQQLAEGMSEQTLAEMDLHLQRGNQVLTFINRRGFAPVLMCHDCGWITHCKRCDARMTMHLDPRHLHCHHCGYQRPIPQQCDNCHSNKLQPQGQGTERIEMALRDRFPDTPVLRVDRDSTRKKGALHELLETVNRGEPCIMIGTQMLAKGHHFPDVTLVTILDADAGLFSTDFRGPERTGQLILQVAGRAGRASKPGRVIIQSHLPEHPLWQLLLHQGYADFADHLLNERHQLQLPPASHMALLRAESKRADNAFQLLNHAYELVQQRQDNEILCLGPLPAATGKKNDRFRFQLQLICAHRGQLHHQIAILLAHLEAMPLSRRVRWSVDIDPQDMN